MSDLQQANGAIVLTWQRKGRGKPIVQAARGGEPLMVERLDLADAKARQRFATRLHQVAGCAPGPTERELLKFAVEAAKPAQQERPEPDVLPELDVSRIVRPERFVTAEVSGVAIPSMMPMGDRVAGRWELYLRWVDGRRERQALRPTIGLPDGGRLWVHPEPAEPTPTMRAGWSAEARSRWLDGEPAPDPAKVFKEICERIAYFLDLPKPEAPGVTATLALWTIQTYCYQAWPAVPYLYIGGPLGSGKSRLFDVLARLVFRPLSSSSMTAASLFRTLHAQGGVLLLDEAERLKDTRDPGVGEILAMLLAGYRRGATATRLEPIGDNFRMVSFEVFGPKALACIAGLPPALASRCIPITMLRSPPGSEKPKRRIDADAASWQRLRDDLHALAMEHGPDFLLMSERADVCPSGIDGRYYELWQPILALAGWIEAAGMGGLLGIVQAHALESIDAARDEQVADSDETILRILAEKRAHLETPQPKDILTTAQEEEPNSFRKWTAKGVSNTLKRYGIRTNTYAGRKVYGKVTLADLERIAGRYGMTLGLREGENKPEA